MKYILPFNKISKEDVQLVGGKGANLGEMIKHGFPVPPGFVVTAQAYDDFLKISGLEKKIRQLLNQLDTNSSSSLEEAARLIHRAFIATPIPTDIELEIKQSYQKLARGKKLYVAVRSSSTGEDLIDATAAGQQLTFLNISGANEVVRYVRETWASLFTPRSLFYLAQKGEELKVGLAVPIQAMVEPESSGISFSLDPVTNDKSKIIVESIYGLGEMIVQGQVTPDHFEFDKTSLEVTYQQLGRQYQQMIRVGNANKIVKVSDSYGIKQKTTLSILKQVAKLTRDLENHFFRPQDVEWAYDGRKLYLVQTRPVTTANQKVARPTSINLPLVTSGAPGSPGIISGRAVIIHSPKDLDRIKKGDILVTEKTSPDYVPAMKRAAAIVTNQGGRTAHAAIVSRELGIPAVVGTTDATTIIAQGKIYTVNGTTGQVHQGAFSPSKITLPFQAKPFTPLVKSDLKTATKVMVNLADPSLADEIASQNIDGVGLLRAEFMMAQIGVHPRFAIKEKLTKAYISKLTDGLVTFAKAFGDRPVIYRTADFKSNEYRNLKGGAEFEKSEDNPMLGYRGAYRYLKEPDELALELEALKRARNVHNCKNIHLMIPFVRSPQELASVKQLITAAGLNRSKNFHIYMMVETPGNVIELEKYAAVGIDGVSVGSNDLTQLTLGVDRDSEKVSPEFNEMDPAVLWCLEKVGREGRKLGLTVGICGQAPSTYPELAAKLVDWGYSYISVSPDMIDQVRSNVHRAEVSLTNGRKK